MNARDFFTADQKSTIRLSIAAAELHTSGEIRVHIENSAGKDALARAKKIFDGLGMHKTAERNGVLFYLAVKDHAFAIYADKGIYERVPHNFWDEVRDAMLDDFSKQKF